MTKDWAGIARPTMAATVMVVLAMGCAQKQSAQTLRMAYPHELVTMDPHAHSDGVTRLVLSAVFESLVRFEPGFPVRPSLADWWTTPDDVTWHIHVRDGVRFHDGRSLTPDDVVMSIERARASGILGHQIDEVESVRVLENGERTIEITTIKPTPLLLTQLESVAIVPLDFEPSAPIGTGPYRWRVGSVQGPLVLDRWQDYWARAPDFDEVNIQFVSLLEELADLLHSQKLDVVASVSESYVSDHEPAESWRVVASPAIATTYLGINVTNPPLDQQTVRAAIDQAIDRRDLVARIYPQGLATPASALAPPEVFGYSPTHRQTTGDIDQARRLLDEAGVAPGARLNLDYQPRYEPVIEPLVAMLAEVDLEVVPRRHRYQTFYRRIEDAENELFIFSWNFRVADAWPFLDAFVHSRNPARGFGSFNGAAISDPEIDRLIEEAEHETRSDTRLELLQLLLADLGAARAYLPLFRAASLALVREPFDVVGREVRPQDVRLR